MPIQPVIEETLGTHPFAASLLSFIFLASTLLLSACSPVTPVSVALQANTEPDGASSDISLSADGRYAVFASEASNLTANDTNAFKDIFLRDNRTGVTELISRTTGGVSGNNLSSQPDISGDGRYVVYWSLADDLVFFDTNGVSDVFIFDRQTGTTERVSVDGNGSGIGSQLTQGSLGGSISHDGRYVVFYTLAGIAWNDFNNDFDIYVRDRSFGTTTLLSKNIWGQAAGQSYEPVISPTDYHVVFTSTANDIIVNDSNGFADVFYLNLANIGNLSNVTLGGNGASALGDVTSYHSGDALIAFSSNASNLTLADTNGQPDVFLQYRSLNSQAFSTVQVTNGNGPSYNPTVSYLDPSGTQNSINYRVTFDSGASDLRPPGAQPIDTNGVSDIYSSNNSGSFSPGSPTMRLISQTSLGGVIDNPAYGAAMSSDGEAIAWASAATNLTLSGSNNSFDDLYVRPTYEPLITDVSGWLEPGTTRVVTLTGEFRNGTSGDKVVIGGDGVVSKVVDVQSDTITLTVELAPTATTGPRDVIVFNDAPQLGIVAPLGSADTVKIPVFP